MAQRTWCSSSCRDNRSFPNIPICHLPYASSGYFLDHSRTLKTLKGSFVSSASSTISTCSFPIRPIRSKGTEICPSPSWSMEISVPRRQKTHGCDVRLASTPSFLSEMKPSFPLILLENANFVDATHNYATMHSRAYDHRAFRPCGNSSRKCAHVHRAPWSTRNASSGHASKSRNDHSSNEKPWMAVPMEKVRNDVRIRLILIRYKIQSYSYI